MAPIPSKASASIITPAFLQARDSPKDPHSSTSLFKVSYFPDGWLTDSKSIVDYPTSKTTPSSKFVVDSASEQRLSFILTVVEGLLHQVAGVMGANRGAGVSSTCSRLRFSLIRWLSLQDALRYLVGLMDNSGSRQPQADKVRLS